MKTDITNCARCSGSHAGLDLQPLTQPILYLGLPLATHWAACPTNGEPIIVQAAYRQPHELKR